MFKGEGVLEVCIVGVSVRNTHATAAAAAATAAVTAAVTDLERRLVNGHDVGHTRGAQQLRDGSPHPCRRRRQRLVTPRGGGARGGRGGGGGGLGGREQQGVVVDGQGEEAGVVGVGLVVLWGVSEAGEAQALCVLRRV